MAKKRQDKLSYKEQFSALNNLPRFFKMIWEASPRMAIANAILRLLKSAVPLLMLYIGKEIIDEVLLLIGQPGEMERLWLLVGLEFGLAILSELMNRAITLLDSLLGDLLSNKSSEELIRHAATLDLYQFEDSNFYDKLERARRQTTGRTALMSMVLTQAQEFITILFLGAGLVAFNPWLILILVLAVLPSFLGETHFNQKPIP